MPKPAAPASSAHTDNPGVPHAWTIESATDGAVRHRRKGRDRHRGHGGARRSHCARADAGRREGRCAWPRREKAEAAEREIEADGGIALALPADVLDRGQLGAARDASLDRWGRLDVLVNAVGGNVASATLELGESFFDLPVEGMEPVIALNLKGALLPCQVFGKTMAEAGGGSIVNISSMAARRAMTRVIGHGVAKAAVENATRWLAVELARSFGAGLRVNAIAPGFFVGEQNRALLLEKDDTPTPRGRTIIAHTPVGRFGEPDDLVGTLIWLCGSEASFSCKVSRGSLGRRVLPSSSAGRGRKDHGLPFGNERPGAVFGRRGSWSTESVVAVGTYYPDEITQRRLSEIPDEGAGRGDDAVGGRAVAGRTRPSDGTFG